MFEYLSRYMKNRMGTSGVYPIFLNKNRAGTLCVHPA